MRSRIVLAAAGQGSTEVGAALGCHPVTAGKAAAFAQHRLDGLSDEPRPGAPRTISDDQVEAVIVETLEQLPCNATHWSTRSMTVEMGIRRPRTEGSGASLASSSTWLSAHGSHPIRSSSTRCAKWPVSISTRPRRLPLA